MSNEYLIPTTVCNHRFSTDSVTLGQQPVSASSAGSSAASLRKSYSAADTMRDSMVCISYLYSRDLQLKVVL